MNALFDPADFPALLVGLAAADDAAVYQINERQAIVTTVDFFPPVVDDPYDFGAIAAANALSDIYAMGGEVLFAVNLVAFPDTLDPTILGEILRGGAEKVKEAGAAVVGGHSVNDKEPKYGLAVTGIIDPALVKRKGGARPGDVLVLTKPLGVGVVTTALKREQAPPEHVAAAVASMKRLNRSAAAAARAANAHAMTDITGFGLLGHAHEMVRQESGAVRQESGAVRQESGAVRQESGAVRQESGAARQESGGVDFVFHAGALIFLPGALDHGRAGAFPGGMGNNVAYFRPHVDFAEGVGFLMQDMLFTPETSGGLLVALAPSSVMTFMELCPEAVVVGEVIQGSGRIHVLQ